MAEAKKTTKKTDEPVLENTEVLETTAVTTDVEAVETTEEKATAKAGKRSAKSLKEADEKVEKEARKESDDDTPKPVQHANPTRTRLERRSKNYRKNAVAVEAGKTYSVEEAIALAKKTSHVKFDATVELHMNLGVDPRHADQNIRDNILLPAGTGNTITIAVLTDDEATAKTAGADLIGADAIFKELDKGNMNFDLLISTPALMAKLGKYARILGPRGLYA